ncbi:MOSC domain-containing protein [Paenibacillus sedimenti]|uniref:MOSC domain-containing protein n=1 Tax=Paenibacillus sedimenti TaxID=2770274 RepID=A0A926KWS0_9BACL|nr:MOSC domain-containing protein [Paenibacillus sedimenti]MBD0383579.1 MOSC domain-containing protein [Paenibacillus sedimenti]
MEIISVNVGIPQTIIYKGKELDTGIYKSPVSSPLHVSKVQLDGDGQADLVNHGGADKALCVYCEEHYAWDHKLDRNLTWGAFGENLTVRGLLEEEVCIGDTYQIGEAIVQVSQPRQPCHKLAKRHDVADLAVQVQDTGFTGYYFRVLQEGIIPVQPEVALVAKHEAGVTVAFANQIMYHDQSNLEGIERILAVEALSASWRESFAKRLVKLQA